MKKFVCFLVTALLALAAFPSLAGCTKREEQLKLYVPGEYIDEELFKEFEQKYRQDTGKKVKVEIDLFNTLEEMLTRMDIEKPDFDLICPSDYAIERMIDRQWVQKFDKTAVPVEELIKDEYLELSRSFDPTLEYSVPYMYGTYGIMYNFQKTQKHLKSWSAIFEGEFTGEIYQKRSMREFYASACMYAKRDELSQKSNGFTDYGDEYKTLLNGIFHDTSAQMLESAKNVLSVQKQYLKKYDDEDGKYQMAQNNGTVGLFWSCDAGYVMSEYEDEDGNVQPGNPNLWYVIPEEGGNVYIDSFVISSFAKNVDAANAFLKFLCEKSVAVANSVYAGAISPVKSAYDSLFAEYSENKAAKSDIFENKTDEWCDMYMDMIFPSAKTLSRCAVNPDYKNPTEEQAIASMFADMTN